MNKEERAKAEALARARINAPGDAQFVRGMALLAKRDPATVLTPRQKWTLDSMVYRYRRQLYSDPKVSVPSQPPQLCDYQPHARQQRQLSLFDVRTS